MDEHDKFCPAYDYPLNPAICVCNRLKQARAEERGTGINDDALMAFVQFCRINEERFIRDRALVRRVFNAYAGIGGADLLSLGLRKRKRHQFRPRKKVRRG